MDLLSEVQQIADQNGDGKLSMKDLDALKERFPDHNNLLNKAKELADQNGDGKVNLADLQKFDMGGLSESFRGVFGK